MTPLAEGYHDLPAGTLATVVTYLEMRARAPLRAERADAPWGLRQVERPALEWYRALYRHVGEDWLWASRLSMRDDELQAIIGAREVEVFALTHDGRDEGILELDARTPGECEIAFFGLSKAMIGTGAGRWLMNRAIARAWSRPLTRLWLHTCSLDAPDALAFYIRSGFEPYDRKIEVFADPRLQGVLPRTAAPRIPLIER